MARKLQRKPGGREREISLVALTEGEVTEKEYYEKIRDDLGIPKERAKFTKSHYTDAPNIVDEAIRQKNANAREHKKNGAPLVEEWFVIVDTECEPDKLTGPIARAKQHNISLIISDPCIEYWLLLHFANTTKQFNTPDGAVSELNKHIPTYNKKNKHPDMEILGPAIANAMKNARLIRKNHTCKGFEQPRTDCDLLVDKLVDLAKTKDVDFEVVPFDKQSLSMFTLS